MSRKSRSTPEKAPPDLSEDEDINIIGTLSPYLNGQLRSLLETDEEKPWITEKVIAQARALIAALELDESEGTRYNGVELGEKNSTATKHVNTIVTLTQQLAERLDTLISNPSTNKIPAKKDQTTEKARKKVLFSNCTTVEEAVDEYLRLSYKAIDNNRWYNSRTGRRFYQSATAKRVYCAVGILVSALIMGAIVGLIISGGNPLGMLSGATLGVAYNGAIAVGTNIGAMGMTAGCLGVYAGAVAGGLFGYGTYRKKLRPENQALKAVVKDFSNTIKESLTKYLENKKREGSYRKLKKPFTSSLIKDTPQHTRAITGTSP